jgi:hypothetical protein
MYYLPFKPKKACLFIFILILKVTCIAQTDTIWVNGVPTLKKPTSVPRIDSLSLKPTFLKNRIKFYPTMLIRVKPFFAYERTLRKHMSIQLGIGKAFGKDVFLESNFNINRGPSGNFLSPAELLSYAKYYNSTPLITGGIKIPFRNGYDENYITVSYLFEKINYELNSGSQIVVFYDPKLTSFVMNGVNASFGHTFIRGKNKHIIHEIFISANVSGYRISTFEAFNPYPLLHTNILYYKKAEGNINKILYGFSFGYIFGFGFGN